MANNNAPYGFQIIGRQDGVSPNWSRRKYPILYSYSTAIAAGDLVKMNATTGNVERSAAGESLALGVVDQFEWYDTAAKQTVYRPLWPGTQAAASGSAYAWVYDDPNAEFEVQASSTVVTAAEVGENADIVATAPSSIGLSQETINSTTLNTTATFPFKIVGLSTRVGNDNASDYNTVRVKGNAWQLNTTTGTA